MNNSKNRAGLMAAVAAYLIYTAWELFQGRNAPNTSMAPWVAVLFAVLFVGVAGGLLVMAWKLWKKGGEEEKEENARREEENSLK